MFGDIALTSRLQVFAGFRTIDLKYALLTAALRTDESTFRRAEPFCFSLVTQHAFHSYNSQENRVLYHISTIRWEESPAVNGVVSSRNTGRETASPSCNPDTPPQRGGIQEDDAVENLLTAYRKLRGASRDTR